MIAGYRILTGFVVLALFAEASLYAQYPTEPPEASRLRPLKFPEFQEEKLGNGLQMVVVENNELPVVSISLRMPAGSAYDPVGLEGLAGMAAELLTKGTAARTAEQIAEEIEGVGGSLTASAGGDFFTVSSTVLTEHVELAFDLIGDVLMNSTFPEEELELARTRTLSALRLERSDPAALANRYQSKALYGNHAYGRRPSETSVQTMTRRAVQEFAESNLKPDGSLLVIAGDIGKSKAKHLADRYLGSWRGEAPRGEIPAAPHPTETEIILVHRPGSEQSNILVSNLTMLPGDPRYYAAVLANRVLGGGVQGRLFLILREEKGWTYGSYSSVRRPRDVGSFVADAEVRNEVTDSALVELLAQVRRMRTEPASNEEIDAAKGYLIGSFPRQIETPQQIANQVSNVKLLGLGVDYLETYREHLAAVTAADIMSAAQQLMHADSAVIVVVGDGQQIYDGLAAIAPVRLIDTEGNPLTVDDLNPEIVALEFDASQLQARRDSFQFLFQGNPMGGLTRELSREGDVFVYLENMSLGMMGSLTSTLKFDAASYALISVERTGQFGGQPMEVHIIAEDGKITGRATSPQKGDVEIDLAWEDGLIESSQLDVLMPTLPLEEGASFTARVLDASEGAIKVVTIRVAGKEEVTVPAGTFSAYRVEMDGLDTPITMMVSEESPRRILRVELGGIPVVLELVK